VLVIAGDICEDGLLESQRRHLNGPFRRWLDGLPAVVVMTVWGNSDSIRDVPEEIPCLRWTLLRNERCTVGETRFFGAAWESEANDTAPDEKQNAACVPEATDVVVAHRPPFGLCDRTEGGKHVGSEELLERLLVVRPRLVICGHVHEARGTREALWGGIVMNVAFVGPDFTPQGPVVTIDL
jgi:Icc-related predicted phosphoesterase